MKFILGQKMQMSQLFADDGKVSAVTIVKAGPCQITQIKTKDRDGYRAVQIGFGEKNKLTKALLGHLTNLPKFRFLKEFKIDDGQELSRGQEIKVNIFQPGDMVKVTGVSKGKGFQGVVKRHGFHGSPASHGHKDQLRMPGSIGSTGPAHIYKGTRMGGRMGGDQVSLASLEIMKVDAEKNLIYINGAVPGARNGLLLIQAFGEIKAIEPIRVPEENLELKNLNAEPEVAEAEEHRPEADQPLAEIINKAKSAKQ